MSHTGRVSARSAGPVRAALVALLLALGGMGVLVATAALAAAHAVLESTSPAQGAELAAAPAAVTLRFGEDVTVTERSLQVLDPSGGRVDDGHVAHPGGDGTAVQVGLRAGLPAASYVVVWRVVSADSHPVSGTYSFGAGVPAGAAPAGAGTTGSPLVGTLLGVARFTAYAGLVLTVGGAVFLAAVWPAGAAARRPRRLLAAGWLLLVASGVALFLLQGPYSAGLGLRDTLSSPVLSETLGTRYGKLVAVRLLVLALAVPVLRRLGVDRDRGQALDLAGLGATLLVTFSLLGHSGTGVQVPLAVAADTLHLAAASVWIGGLVILAAVLLRETPDPAAAAVLPAALPRWSRIAMASVVVLAVTGTYQSWREVGTLPALPGTPYGRLLLVKLGGFALLLALGDLGRRLVQRHAAPARRRLVAHAAADVAAVQNAAVPAPDRTAAPPVAAIRTLRRSVAVEVGVAAAVLGLTAALVAAVPAREAYAPSYSATVRLDGLSGPPLSAVVEVDRTSVGAETLHLYTYDSTGRVQPFAAAQGLLDEQAEGLGPVRFSFADTGPGHGAATGVVVPARGTWRLSLIVRVGETSGYAGTTSYEVRS